MVATVEVEATVADTAALVGMAAVQAVMVAEVVLIPVEGMVVVVATVAGMAVDMGVGMEVGMVPLLLVATGVVTATIKDMEDPQQVQLLQEAMVATVAVTLLVVPLLAEEDMVLRVRQDTSAPIIPINDELSM